MKCSLPGLDEVVSMTWRASKLRKVGLHEVVVIERPAVCAWLRCRMERHVSKSCEWVQGAR
jgi:hypothetical protein